MLNFSARKAFSLKNFLLRTASAYKPLTEAFSSLQKCIRHTAFCLIQSELFICCHTYHCNSLSDTDRDVTTLKLYYKVKDNFLDA